ncbi:MAG: hypothetical protein LBF01_03675 [Bacteroidales bacterium]|jgi:hypothetical protein|nr:hypothetical protein [Bacteroidales bacterium]
MRSNKQIKYPIIISVLVFIAGSVLFLCSVKMPKFTDENKYHKLVDEFRDMDSLLWDMYNIEIAKKTVNEKANKDKFQKLTQDYSYNDSTYDIEIKKISTNKFFFLNFGSGLIVFSLFWFLSLIICRVSKWNDFKTIEAKGNKFLFVFSNIVWSLTILWTFIHYTFRATMGYYPPYIVDNIHIPILFQISVCVGFFPFINLFLIFSLLKSKLPTKLFIKYEHKRKKSVFLWEISFFLLLVIDVILLFLFIIDGRLIPIMVSMCFVYVLLSLRAGKLNYYNHKTNE